MHDACICRNCYSNLFSGRKNKDYKPRWRKTKASKPYCEVIGCGVISSRCTKLASKEDISSNLQCTLPPSQKHETHLCDRHYRDLHRQLSPSSYQWNCTVCSVGIRGSNYHGFRTCAEPEVFERHLRENTNFDGKIKSIDKVCNACYRFSLLLSRSFKQKKKSCDEEFKSLLESIQNSLGSKPLPFSDEKKIVDYALILSAITIAEKLLKNEALTLPSAHEIFTMHMKYLQRFL